jgi:ABC-2 type transport system ATP-binding protein
VRDLVKVYGGHRAVDGVDLDVAEGEIVAFLGPNGAGKTTTVEILEGYRSRTSGEVSVLGLDPAEATSVWRERIGIVLQESEPVPELTALEAVTMHSHYYTAPRRADEILAVVGLADSAHQRTRKLSGGQKRRLDLALALVGDPELIFLDEPTTGFDPSARRESWQMIEALRDVGRTVLLTTHYMDEAEHLADRIVVIAGGRIVATGTAAALARQVEAEPRITWRHDPGGPRPPSSFDVHLNGDRAEISTNDIVATTNALTSWALAHHAPLDELNIHRPSLEDVYLALTSGASPAGAVIPDDETPTSAATTPVTPHPSAHGDRP